MWLKAWKDSWSQLFTQNGIWNNERIKHLFTRSLECPSFGGMLCGLLVIMTINVIWLIEIFDLKRLSIFRVLSVIISVFKKFFTCDDVLIMLSYALVSFILSIFILSYIYKTFSSPNIGERPKDSHFLLNLFKSTLIILCLHAIFLLFFGFMRMLAKFLSQAFIDQSIQKINTIFFYTSWSSLVLYTHEFADRIANLFMSAPDIQNVFDLFMQNIFLWINPWVMFALLHLWRNQQSESLFGSIVFSFKKCLYNYPFLLVNNLYILILMSSSVRLLRKYLNAFFNSGEFSWLIPLLFFAVAVWFITYVANIFYVYELSKKSNAQ